MRKHNWPMLIKSQAKSGQTITAFCTAHGIAPSLFYAERSKHARKTLLPIVVDSPALQITVHLHSPISLSGSASDLAQLLRCL
jgi:hypothetical protein